MAVDRTLLFWSKIDRTGDCWLWTSYHSTNGRPYTSRESNDGIELVGRRIYRELVGPLTSEMHLHHLCRNPKCVNPDHVVILDVSTHSRLHAAERWKDTCAKGHLLDAVNTGIGVRGYRYCRTCQSMRQRVAYARKIGKSLDEIRPQKRRY